MKNLSAAALAHSRNPFDGDSVLHNAGGMASANSSGAIFSGAVCSTVDDLVDGGDLCAGNCDAVISAIHQNGAARSIEVRFTGDIIA